MSIEPKDDFVEIAEQRAQTAIDLENARRLLARGWCQGRAQRRTLFGFGRTQLCTTAAIAAVAGDDVDRAYNCSQALFATVFPMVKPRAPSQNVATLQGWNDRPHRTKADILAAFDGAIAHLRAGRV